ncbi:MAG TPA: nitric-oxide reductase large subunit [Gemmataceae bacterium]|nr:nitric-oxide reductase large subunit [Gemmataceae bacterium]
MNRAQPSHKRLWIALTFVFVASFAVLGGYGFRIASMAPPIPDKVCTPDGRVLFDGETIRTGQNVWQSLGGQQIGSIWGHGAYVAPDWSADWLHRELVFILDRWAKERGVAHFDELSSEDQAALRVRLKKLVRANTYDAATGTLTLDPLRAEAFEANAAHYTEVFAEGRPEYAIPAGALTDPERQHALTTFFFWTAWACGTDRPDLAISYTQNWPHEPLIDNKPTVDSVVWSILSFVLLLAGIGGMVWYFAAQSRHGEDEAEVPHRNPLLNYRPTPSQKATLKYFYVAVALLLAQIGLGAITAHYGVEGGGFYGIALDQILPYAVTRTWHTQLGIFWIATTWLATGLFMAPAVGGHEPKGQRFLVNVLFVSLVTIVVGSLAGEWLSVQQKLHGDAWFWFGHQGYEYVDLGRFWQLYLLAGLFIWLALMARGLWPALRRPGEHRSLLALFLISSLAIASFYGAGLGIWKHTHLAMAEYWRWWVVHLWVEGFFEVFATVVIAFLFSRLQLIRTSTATSASLFSTSVFLSGGIIGTFHHLYFAGTPSVVMALGAMFSALEVVPLVLVGFEAWENIRLTQLRRWVGDYRWAIYFFVAVAFWNLIGAGLFGFLINPPIALYYMQGLNTTPVHGHSALFGVYGMLGLGLMLFCLRGLMPNKEWRTGAIRFSFWTLNAGLMLMVVLSLLPVGLMQTWAAVSEGTWYARSAEFMQTPLMQQLRWLRVVGDTIFAAGVLALVWFKLGLLTGHSYAKPEELVPSQSLAPEAESIPVA